MLTALVAGAFALAAFAVGELIHDQRGSAWETRAAAAVASADSARAVADAAASREVVYQARVDSLARLAEDQGRRLRSRVVNIRAVAAPDTCAPFVASRDSIIDSALSALNTWETARAFQIVVVTELHVQVDALRASSDSLRSVLSARPSPRNRFIPEIRPYVGYGFKGPDVGIGLTWKLF